MAWKQKKTRDKTLAYMFILPEANVFRLVLRRNQLY